MLCFYKIQEYPINGIDEIFHYVEIYLEIHYMIFQLLQGDVNP